MPRPWPQPNITNSVDIIDYANTATLGWMTTLFVIAFAVMAFALLKNRGTRTSDSLLISLILSMVMGSLLWSIHLLAGKIMVILLLLTIAAGFYTVFDND